MSYYSGDFYYGPRDFMPGRGDPGFFSFLGGIAKKAVGLIPGVGPAASAALEHIPTGGMRGAAGSAIRKVGGVVMKHPVLSGAAAAGAVAAAGAGAERMLMRGGACPAGHHISKSKHAKHFGQCVKNRRMNACNPRALRRAVRRLHSFARHYRHVVAFASPHPKKGRMYFKKRRRAK